jgi:hypothetical protein
MNNITKAAIAMALASKRCGRCADEHNDTKGIWPFVRLINYQIALLILSQFYRPIRRKCANYRPSIQLMTGQGL